MTTQSNLTFPAFRMIIPAVLVIGLLGCNKGTPRPDTVQVSGTVTLDGEPLKQGRISFQKPNALQQKDYTRPATGVIENGKYTLTTFEEGDGVIPGDYVVTVESFEKQLTMEEIDEGKKQESAIPTKYNSAKTSGLTATVPESGPATIDFPLTK